MTQVVFTEDDPLKNAQPNPGGRPRSLLPDEHTLRQVHTLASYFASKKEAAALMGVTEKTFITFLNTFTAAREAWDTGFATGQVSTRRRQVQNAMDGDTAMLIWLGKNYLGQTDRRETVLTSETTFEFTAKIAGRAKPKIINETAEPLTIEHDAGSRTAGE